MSKSKNKGFTLIELLVVIVVISIFISIAFVSFGRARVKSRDARRISDLNNIKTALDLYYENNNSKYPISLKSLEASGYLLAEPKDPRTDASYNYAYHPPVKPNYFHLGADLEELNSPFLDSDKDCDSSVADSCAVVGSVFLDGFNGQKGSCEEIVGEERCYDLVR